jgi:two-component system chemotaxis sensor kinase CheA
MSKPGNILIVDDSGTNLFLLQRLLEDEGYSVVIAEDPKEGLNYVNKNSDVSLILLDIMMPGIDGFEFMKQLSENGKMADITVVMVTAKDDRETQKKAVDLGAKDYITKPLDLQKVISIIQKYLG